MSFVQIYEPTNKFHTMANKFFNTSVRKEENIKQMKALRERLPDNWMELFIEMFPECDTIHWGVRLREAVLLRQSDIEVYLKLMDLVKHYESQKKAS